jgi:hypothetical protein
MEKEFIPYGLALRMKVIGFDEPCFGYYEDTGLTITFPSTSENGWKWVGNSIIPTKNTSAPTYSQAFRWFREKYNYHHYIEPIHRDGKVQYEYCVVDSSDDAKEFNEDDIISTYEEAELECLKKLIEIVESKII